MNDVNHCAFAVKLGAVRKHPNADKLMITNIFGCDVVVGLGAEENDLGIYFQSELQLSKEFAEANDLIRRKDPVTGKNVGGMFDENRRVRAQNLRGHVSDGFFIGLDSLEKAGITTIPKPGKSFDTLDGIPICCKYVPATGKTKGIQRNNQTAGSKKKREVDKVFKQHFSTPQLRFKVDFIDTERYCVVTEKMEGTSGRSGYHEVTVPMITNKLQRWVINTVGPKGLFIDSNSTMSHKEQLIGSRRVVLTKANKDSGFHDPSLRELADKPFNGNLKKGETVFYEIVGYEPNGGAIMGTRDNTKIGKEFVKQYGKTTVFTYGCEPKKFKIFVYRITMTSNDGESIDYPWNAVESRCEELGVQTVPVLWKGVIKSNRAFEICKETSAAITQMMADFNDGPSTVDQTHIREGACLRVEGDLKPQIYKDKNDNYKVLAGINTATVVVDNDAKDEQ